MMLIPDASLEGLRITNEAAQGLRDLGNDVQNWKHMRRIDSIAAARSAFDMATQAHNADAQLKAIQQMQTTINNGGEIGLGQIGDQETINQDSIANPFYTGVDPETSLAAEQGYVTLAPEQKAYIDGSHSERQKQLMEAGRNAFEIAKKKGDYNGMVDAMAKTQKSIYDNDQRFNIEGTGGSNLDWMAGYGSGKSGKPVYFYYFDKNTGRRVNGVMDQSDWANGESQARVLREQYGVAEPNTQFLTNDDTEMRNIVARKSAVDTNVNAQAKIVRKAIRKVGWSEFPNVSSGTTYDKAQEIVNNYERLVQEEVKGGSGDKLYNLQIVQLPRKRETDPIKYTVVGVINPNNKHTDYLNNDPVFFGRDSQISLAQAGYKIASTRGGQYFLTPIDRQQGVQEQRSMVAGGDAKSKGKSKNGRNPNPMFRDREWK